MHLGLYRRDCGRPLIGKQSSCRCQHFRLLTHGSREAVSTLRLLARLLSQRQSAYGAYCHAIAAQSEKQQGKRRLKPVLCEAAGLNGYMGAHTLISTLNDSGIARHG
ncbi:hypothetical protein WJX82_005345 [Trebouxia sp. C0006]